MEKTVLVVDDDAPLSKLVSICLEESGQKVCVKNVQTAEEALDYVRGSGAYSDRLKNPLPAVILLDLRLPTMTGMEFLDKLKTSAEYRTIPVAVLTAMESATDIKGAFLHNANSCLSKPFGYDGMKKVMTSFASYWIKYNRLPGEDKAQ